VSTDYERGQADASVWNAELYSDETADQHWQDTRERLMRLARDDNFVSESRQLMRSTDPAERSGISYDRTMAVMLRDGLPLPVPGNGRTAGTETRVTIAPDAGMHPHGRDREATS
jgi:hypothetical protein